MQNLGLSFGTVVSCAHAGALFAPAVGGFIFERFGGKGIITFLECILGVDLLLRLLIVDPHNDAVENLKHTISNATEQETSANSPLLGDARSSSHERTSAETSGICFMIPVLHCFKDPAFVAAMALTCINAGMTGGFDATVPLHGKEHYNASPAGVGLLLVSLAISRVVFGPLGGRLVDRLGTSKVGVAGYACLTLGLALFLLTTLGPRILQITGFEVVLSLCGAGLAIVGSATWVEGMTAVQRYHVAHPHLFSQNGPYASLQALNMMIFQIGLALGPVVAGALRDWLGFEYMSAVFAAVMAVSGLVTYRYFHKHEL